MEEAANTIVSASDVQAVADTITANISEVAPKLFLILGAVLAIRVIYKLVKKAA